MADSSLQQHDDRAGPPLHWNEAAREQTGWLFSSWLWTATWWKHFGGNGQARLIAIGAADGCPADTIALHTHVVRINRLLQIRRMELIGNHWQMDRSCPSEFVKDPVGVDTNRAALVRSLQAAFARDDWDEFVACRIQRGSAFAEAVMEAAQELRMSVFVERENPSFFIDLTESWSSYTANLSGSVRRKLLHERKKLGQSITVQTVTSVEADEALSELEGLVTNRFGETAATASINRFFRDLAVSAGRSGQLDLTLLRVDGRTISIMYCLRYGKDVFFLRLGFQEVTDSRVSPGTLHLGYVLQKYLGSEGRFWLLSGSGKTTHYKNSLAKPVALSTIRVIRRPHLALLMTVKKAMRRSRLR